MNDVILSHRSALEFWRLARRACLARNRLDVWRDDLLFGVRALEEGSLDLAHGGMLHKGDLGASIVGSSEAQWVLENSGIPGPSAFAPLAENVPLLQHLELPLNVLVNGQAKVHKSSRASAHIRTKEMREGMLVKVADGVYVCSPEFTFAQMAPKLSRARLVLVGLEMCGGYALAPDTSRGFADCHNITTAARLREFLKGTLEVGSRSQVLVAARRVADGAASPAESSLFAELTFPRKEGGCGLPAPELNGRIKPGVEAPSYFAFKSYYCDLLWRDAYFAIEYEGKDAHTGYGAVERDTQRENDLVQLGYTVVPVSAGKIRTREGVQQIEEITRGKLKLRKKPTDPPTYQELRRNLIAELR